MQSTYSFLKGAGLLLLLVFTIACGNEPSVPAQESTTTEVEETPEWIAESYVTALHNGKFNDAKAWVTPAGLAYVEALQAVMEGTDAPADATIKVGKAQCVTAEQVNQRRCSCQVDDGFERFTEQLVLTQTTEGWRVDHESDEGATSTTTASEPIDH